MKNSVIKYSNLNQNHISKQEMMYVWNGFTVVGKRPGLTESILTTLDEAEKQLRDDPSEL